MTASPVDSKGDAPDLDSRAGKVHQQAEPQTRCAQVVHALSDMNIVHGPHDLELDEDQLLHEKVGYVLADDDPIVADGHRILLLKVRPQFMREGVLIDLSRNLT